MTTFTLNPFRFTADVPRMVAFLEAVGLRRAITTDSQRFAVLVAEHGGAVSIHDAAGSDTEAPAGETQLVFSVDSVAAAQESLAAAGIAATVWDESYGRHGGVIDPTGGGIWLNEETDFYGYRTHEVEPGGGAVVTAVRYSPDFAADQAFFAAFGLTQQGYADEWWTPLSGDSVGIIGLHKPSGQALSRPTPGTPLPTVSLVELGFETTRDLDELAASLTAAGFPAQVVREEHLTSVHVTDPDGGHVEIHQHRH